MIFLNPSAKKSIKYHISIKQTSLYTEKPPKGKTHGGYCAVRNRKTTARRNTTAEITPEVI